VPILHLHAGSNSSGKSTFVERVLQPFADLPFVYADVIAQRGTSGRNNSPREARQMNCGCFVSSVIGGAQFFNRGLKKLTKLRLPSARRKRNGCVVQDQETRL